MWNRRVSIVGACIVLLCIATAPAMGTPPSSRGGPEGISWPAGQGGNLRSETCGRCHKRVYDEWRMTQHSRSGPDADPLVNLAYAFLARRGYDTDRCDTCHAPMKAIRREVGAGPSPSGEEGVGCAPCHAISGIRAPRSKGTHHYRFDFTGLQQMVLAPAPHPRRPASLLEMFRAVDICAGCHVTVKNEYSFLPGGKRQLPCQQCHMPSSMVPAEGEGEARDEANGEKRQKIHRHLFEGGHSDLILGMSGTIGGELRKTDGAFRLSLRVENFSLHPIPTGYPLREIWLRAVAFDRKGRVAWSNHGGDPAREAPEAWFAKRFRPEEELFAHHLLDAAPLADTRLKAREIRFITYDLPPGEISRVEVKLYYRLLQESAIRKLGVPAGLVRRVTMAEETIHPAEGN